MTVSEFILETLWLMGIEYIFGNPGTTEISLVTACHGDNRPKYVVGLSELASVAMSDGYARARRSLGVANLHVAPGLGNAIGAIYTASNAHTPLLVIVGSQDRRHLASSPVLDGPLEAMVGPLVKGTYTLTDALQAPLLIRQAIRKALAPHAGPVALICPMDIMEQPVTDHPIPVTIPNLGGISKKDATEIATEIDLMENPAIIVADDVFWCNAENEAAALGQALQAPIYLSPYTGVFPVDASSPYYAGYVPPNRSAWARLLKQYGGLIFLGGAGLRPTLYSQGSLPQPKIWIGSSPQVLGSDGEFQRCVIADLKQAIQAITESIGKRQTSRENIRPKLAIKELDPMHPTAVVDYIMETVGTSAYIVDDSGLSTTDIKAMFKGQQGGYIANGSGGIGWGIPASVGAMFAGLSVPILAIVGDGTVPYGVEALWTASHWGKTGNRLIILSNRRYATLNLALQKLTGKEKDQAFDLENPPINFAGLASAYGWEYFNVSCRSELEDAIARSSLASKRNWVIEINISPALIPVTAADHF